MNVSSWNLRVGGILALLDALQGAVKMHLGAGKFALQKLQSTLHDRHNAALLQSVGAWTINI
jgi:hypothetical protein